MWLPSIMSTPRRESSTNIFVTEVQYNAKTVKCSLESELGSIQSRAEDQIEPTAAVDSKSSALKAINRSVKILHGYVHRADTYSFNICEKHYLNQSILYLCSLYSHCKNFVKYSDMSFLCFSSQCINSSCRNFFGCCVVTLFSQGISEHFLGSCNNLS